MGGRFNRDKRRKYTRELYNRYYRLSKIFNCPNCKERLEDSPGHFVPPSMGERGFFICPLKN